VDLIFVITSGATRAAKEATSPIPIVFSATSIPSRLGLVKSLAQPGGNTTGVLIAPDGTLAANEWYS
jgi:putative ABC transport system substrate-binding protein